MGVGEIVVVCAGWGLGKGEEGVNREWINAVSVDYAITIDFGWMVIIIQ
jgi:hypothetical protein